MLGPWKGFWPPFWNGRHFETFFNYFSMKLFFTSKYTHNPIFSHFFQFQGHHYNEKHVWWVSHEYANEHLRNYLWNMHPFQKVSSHIIQDYCWFRFSLQMRIYLKLDAELDEKMRAKYGNRRPSWIYVNRKKWNFIFNRWDIHLQV